MSACNARYGPSSGLLARGVACAVTETAPSLDNERYRLVRRLGAGGAGTVYQAFDARLEVWRAIKLLDPRVLSSSSRERFEREARILARVRHRNVLVVFDVVIQSERPYVVMDLVPGGSLADRLAREGSISPRVACRLVRGVLAGLQCAHDHGVVHRDVKPHNILVAADGSPLVGDFGIDRLATDDWDGAVGGALAYAAPEQRSDAEDADARVDVYAAACTLYTLIAGREPREPYVDGPTTWDEIPVALVPALRRATRWDRADRWPTAAAFAEALAAVEQDLPETAGDETTVTLEGPIARPRPRPWGIVAAGLLGVLGAFGAWWAGCS